MSDDMNKAAGGDAKQNAEDGKVCAILAYLLIGIIWYFVDEKQKNNPFTKYHVKQGLVLLIVSFVLHILGFMLGMATCGIGLIVNMLATMICIVLAILGIINAANGEMKELPVIGKYGEEWFKF